MGSTVGGGTARTIDTYLKFIVAVTLVPNEALGTLFNDFRS